MKVRRKQFLNWISRRYCNFYSSIMNTKDIKNWKNAMHQKVNEAVKITILIDQPVYNNNCSWRAGHFPALKPSGKRAGSSLRHLPKKHRRGVCVTSQMHLHPSTKPASALSIHFYCIKNCRRKAKLWVSSPSAGWERERELRSGTNIPFSAPIMRCWSDEFYCVVICLRLDGE